MREFQIWVYPNTDRRLYGWMKWIIGEKYHAYWGDPGNEPAEDPAHCVAHGRTPEQAHARAAAYLTGLVTKPKPVLTETHQVDL